jgi:hypothetical protein
MPKLSKLTTNGEERRERLAANIADLSRLDNLMRGILLSGKLAERHVITDKSQCDEAAVELTCSLLTAATTLDIIRDYDRRAGRHPTRTYLRRAVAWVKLPGGAMLSIVEDGVKLNPAIFPPDESHIYVKPIPRSVEVLL